jgi:hypothetical protein
MPWYIWLLIGLWDGGTAGFFLAGLLHCIKGADERGAMFNARRSGMNLGPQEHRENTFAKRWVYGETRT